MKNLTLSQYSVVPAKTIYLEDDVFFNDLTTILLKTFFIENFQWLQLYVFMIQKWQLSGVLRKGFSVKLFCNISTLYLHPTILVKDKSIIFQLLLPP